MEKKDFETMLNGLIGFTIGVCCMLLVYVNKEQTINYCLEEEIQEIEFSVCEECWYDVFDGGDMYQY